MGKRKCPPYTWVGYKREIVGISKNVAKDWKKDFERNGECSIIKKFKYGINPTYVVYHAPKRKVTKKLKKYFKLANS